LSRQQDKAPTAFSKCIFHASRAHLPVISLQTLRNLLLTVTQFQNCSISPHHVYPDSPHHHYPPRPHHPSASAILQTLRRRRVPRSQKQRHRQRCLRLASHRNHHCQRRNPVSKPSVCRGTHHRLYRRPPRLSEPTPKLIAPTC